MVLSSPIGIHLVEDDLQLGVRELDSELARFVALELSLEVGSRGNCMILY